MKKITVALAGNPNCGKTTLFNNLTGLRHHVGNWPGKTVTVEKKEGKIIYDDMTLDNVDLPGTYSLSGRSLEEEIAVSYLLNEKTGCSRQHRGCRTSGEESLCNPSAD